MIANTDNIADLLSSGDAKLLTGKVGPPETIIQGLQISRGALIIDGDVALPIVDGKTSLKAFGELRADKYAALFARPVQPTKQIAGGLYIHGAQNFYHFLAFHLPSLLLLNPATPQIFTAHWGPPSVAAFLTAFLPSFVGRPVEVARISGGAYDVSNVVLPFKPTPAATVYFARRVLLPWIAAPRAAAPIKLFVKRKAATRCLSNQDEVETWFAARGYISVDPGERPFEEQASLFNSASHIAGVEGAAMTNILFATNARRVLLLRSPAVASETFFSIFRKHYGYRFDSVTGAIGEPRPVRRDSDFTVAISDLAQVEGL